MTENTNFDEPIKTEDELKSTLDKLEQEVLDELENPYKPYRVINPFEVAFTIPDDQHNTEVIIRTKIEEVRYARSEHDVRLQKEIDNRHGRATYAKHIVDWVRPRLKDFDWKECQLEYIGEIGITLMTNKEVKDYRDFCLYDYEKEYG
jgi:hypothetical protein